MTIAQACLLFAAFLLVLSKGPVAVAQNRRGGYDNNNPREQQAALEGWGRRAVAAHQNTLEAFPYFAAGILMAQSVNAPQGWTDALALAFVVARLAYQGLYLADIATARSLSWGVGFIASLALIAAPLWS